MKCAQAQPNLLDYSQGRLSQRETDAIRTHLQGCSECRAVLEEEIALDGRLSNVQMISPRSDVWNKVESKIAPMPRRSGFFDLVHSAYVRRVGAAMTALTVAGLAMVMVFPHQAGPDERESIAKAAALVSTQPIAAAKADTRAALPTGNLTTVDDPVGGTTDDMMKVLEDAL